MSADDAQLFARLICDGQESIATLPREKKDVLVSNLEPAMAGAAAGTNAESPRAEGQSARGSERRRKQS